MQTKSVLDDYQNMEKLNNTKLLPKSYKYKAFLSYSHEDKEICDWLHKELENYIIPGKFLKEYLNLPDSLYPVFRDVYEISGGIGLPQKISDALYNSDTLIVLCSLASAKSIWVNKEIIEFKQYRKDNHRIIPVVIDGEPFAKDEAEECLPDAFKYKIDNNFTINKKVINEEINKEDYLFLRIKDGRELLVLKLIAWILNIEPGELYKRDEMRKREELAKVIKQKEELQKAKDLAEKSLIIAENKSQALSILIASTLESLIESDEKVLELYLDKIINSNEKEIFLDLLKLLISQTESMEEEERENLSYILPNMDITQLSELVNILFVERQTLRTVGDKVLKELHSLLRSKFDKAHNDCFIEKNSDQCLFAAKLILNNPEIFENIPIVEEYLNEYNKLKNEPTALYYDTYARYLKKNGKKEEAFELVNKAVDLNPNDISHLSHLKFYYVENKDYKNALLTQTKIVNTREESFIKEPENQIEARCFLSEINELFNFQYHVNREILVYKLYPKYEHFIGKIKDCKYALLFDYLNILSYVAKSYGTLENYIEASNFFKILINCYYEKNNKTDIPISWISLQLQNLVWYQLLSREYSSAIENSIKGIELDIKNVLSLETNLAHAYLLSDNFERAHIIYLKNKGKIVHTNKRWEELIMEDFSLLRESGIINDNFYKIEEMLK